MSLAQSDGRARGGVRGPGEDLRRSDGRRAPYAEFEGRDGGQAIPPLGGCGGHQSRGDALQRLHEAGDGARLRCGGGHRVAVHEEVERGGVSLTEEH